MPQLDFPFEREAMRSAPMPDGLDELTDQLAYQALAHLYARYNLKKLDRDTASADKRKILSAWKKQKSLDEHNKRMSDHHTRVMMGIESCANTYRKAKSPEEAIQAANGILSAIDGVSFDEITKRTEDNSWRWQK